MTLLNRVPTGHLLSINSIPGFFHAGDIAALYGLASQVPSDGKIVEVGSLFGKSASCLALAAPGASVYCFDIWVGNEYPDSTGTKRPNDIEVFKSFTNQFLNIQPIKISDGHFNWPINNSVDLLFLDAAHVNPADWNILQYWLPRIKVGGILCGHDYIDGYPDVKTNVKLLESILNQRVTLYPNSIMWSFVLPKSFYPKSIAK